MESLAFYWDFFCQVEKSELAGFVHTLGNPLGRWAAPYLTLLLLFALEFVFPWHRGQRKLRPGLALDVFYVYFNTLLLWVLFGNAVTQTAVLAFNHALSAWFGIENLVAIELTNMQMWARYALMLLFGDFIGYLGHWLLHRVGFLWEFHKIHHSSEVLDVWNAQRFHVGEQMFWPFFNYVPMALIGFPTGEVFIAGLIMSLLSSFSHANIKLPLGPLKYIINNPQLHVWHHAKSVDSRRNVNYGDSLCMWDWLFGTAYLPPERPGLKLGFEGVDEFPTTLLGQLVHPFREILRRVRARLAGIFAQVPLRS